MLKARRPRFQLPHSLCAGEQQSHIKLWKRKRVGGSQIQVVTLEDILKCLPLIALTADGDMVLKARDEKCTKMIAR